MGSGWGSNAQDRHRQELEQAYDRGYKDGRLAGEAETLESYAKEVLGVEVHLAPRPRRGGADLSKLDRKPVNPLRGDKHE